jgi:hypothetical protein
MKTGEDVLQQGWYASRCCGYEQTFDKQATFQRCPACDCLCEWELGETELVQKKTKREAA